MKAKRTPIKNDKFSQNNIICLRDHNFDENDIESTNAFLLKQVYFCSKMFVNN